MSLKTHLLRTVIMSIVFAIIAATLFSALYLTDGAQQGLMHGTP